MAAGILGKARGPSAVLAPSPLPWPGRQCLLCPFPEASHKPCPLLAALAPYLHLPPSLGRAASGIPAKP